MSEEHIDLIFDRLFDYFEVGTISDLSKKMAIPQSTISKWKQRKSVSAIKKVCRELSIYNEIFNGKYYPLQFQSGTSKDNSTFNQVGRNQKNIHGNDLTPQEQTLLDCFRKASEELQKQILILAISGKL